MHYYEEKAYLLEEEKLPWLMAALKYYETSRRAYGEAREIAAIGGNYKEACNKMQYALHKQRLANDICQQMEISDTKVFFLVEALVKHFHKKASDRMDLYTLHVIAENILRRGDFQK